MSLILIFLAIGLPLLGIGFRVAGVVLGWAIALVAGTVVFTVSLALTLARRKKPASKG